MVLTRRMLRTQTVVDLQEQVGQDIEMEEQDVKMIHVGQEQAAAGGLDLTDADLMDEDEYISNAEFLDDEDDDEYEDIQENAVGLHAVDVANFVDQEQRPLADNHLPFQFYNNPGTVLFYYFIGLYTGDGYHNAANTLIGFNFKSISFAYDIAKSVVEDVDEMEALILVLEEKYSLLTICDSEQ